MSQAKKATNAPSRFPVKGKPDVNLLEEFFKPTPVERAPRKSKKVRGPKE